MELGYRMFDCASFYKNEELVGAELKDCGVERKDLFIISKVWVDEVEDCEAAVRRSLAKLQTDYLDLYMIHWPVAVKSVGIWKSSYRTDEDGEDAQPERINLPMHKIWAQMEALVEKGLVKNIGVSNFSIQVTWDMLSYANIKPVINEIEIHPLNTNEKLVKYLKSQ